MRTLILIMAVFMTGCKEDEPENIVMEADVGLFYENKKGVDLLNPDTDEAYSERSIKLYYLIDGEKVAAYDGNMDNPDYYTIRRHPNGKFYIGIDLSTYKDDKDQSVTYIALNESDTDTIICVFRPDTYIDKTIYYNESLISDAESDDRVPVTIVK